MTAAYRLRGLGWFLSGVVVVLGFYLVSLQVAAERKKVEDVERKILIAKREIRGLETEFDTRANFAQLERWNNDVFGMTVPASTQFVGDEAALASIDVRGGGAESAATVQMASTIVPAAPPIDALIHASQAAPAQVAVTTVATPVEVTASHRAAAKAAPPATQAVAMLDRKLLSDAVLGDLVAGADAEAKGSR